MASPQRFVRSCWKLFAGIAVREDSFCGPGGSDSGHKCNEVKSAELLWLCDASHFTCSEGSLHTAILRSSSQNPLVLVFDELALLVVMRVTCLGA
jgi:hypothetical protein